MIDSLVKQNLLNIFAQQPHYFHHQGDVYIILLSCKNLVSFNIDLLVNEVYAFLIHKALRRRA